MNRFCDSCGAPTIPRARFCENCGTALSAPPAQSPSPPGGSAVNVVQYPPVPAPAGLGAAKAVPAEPSVASSLSSPGKRLGASLLEVLLIVVTLAVGWLIWSVIVWARGQTPAKQLLGMRVIRADNHQVATWGTMALREFVGKSLISTATCGISSVVGALMVLGLTRQALWDKVAATLVIDES